MPCPCDPKRLYVDCCARLHRGEPAADAEALMRSRYSAYVLGLSEYLLATWHPSTRPRQLDLAEPPDRRTTWLGLAIKRHVDLDDGRAEVEFVARYRVGGTPARRQRECSRFVCEEGAWLYLDGEIG
jgi:SEC-C motif domain protein